MADFLTGGSEPRIKQGQIDAKFKIRISISKQIREIVFICSCLKLKKSLVVKIHWLYQHTTKIIPCQLFFVFLAEISQLFL